MARKTLLNKIIIGVIVVAAVVYGVWYAMTQKSANEVSSEPIKIGISAPMTGEAASYGQNMVAGATLAINEINEIGGINGRKIELVVEDDKCSPEGVTAINKLINVDNVTVLYGPACSGVASAGLSTAQNSKTPSLIIASAPGITNIGDYIFRVYPADDFGGSAAAEFIFNKLEKKKAAVVYVKNAWGEGLRGVFVKQFKGMGGEVVYESGVLQANTDLRTEIAKIKSSGADVLYFPVYASNVSTAFKQIKEAGLSLPIVGGDAFEAEEVFSNSYADGVFYPAGKTNLPDGFKLQINSLSGFEDLQVSIWAPISYDAIKVIATAIQKAGLEKEALRDAITKTSYKAIAYPTIEFNDSRELNNPIMVIKVIKDGTAVEYVQP